MAATPLPVGREASKPLSARNRAFLRKRQAAERPVQHRTLTASAEPIDLTDRAEARRLRVLRQGWQQDAANYVDATPELSFAYRFLAHASSRMRYFPALVNPDEPDGPPIPVEDVEGVPQSVVDIMHQAMSDLGVGRMALAPMQESMSYQFGVPGECYLLGQGSPGAPNAWTIRSIEEFMVFDDQYKLREVPLDPQGTLGWEDLDPDNTYACRMWVPHWRFQRMATSPMRSLLDVAEELLMLSRDVRATARSRLAGSGILKIPEGLRMESLLQDDEFAESENWFGRFSDAMMTPLSDEGTASAVVPIGISGDAESLAQLDHLVIDRPYSALAMELRQEAIGRLATGVDVPREVLEGISDPNHWGGWLVSDDTFRHHIEPQVITQVDSLSLAYLRTWMTAAGCEQYWVNRACIWYNPVDLITKPDPMANAILMHDRFAISDAALREAGGATEEQAPEILEIYRRQLSHMRSFSPNVTEAIIHAVDPNMVIPPINASGQIPGMGPKGAIQPTVPSAVPPGGVADDSTVVPPDQGPPAIAPPGTGTPPAAATGAPAIPAMATEPIALTVPETSSVAPAAPEAPLARRAPTAEMQRLSRKLAQIDAELRARIQSAANGAMMRVLDRSGAKLRTKITDRKFKDADTKSLIVGVPNRRIAEKLGPALVASVGFASTRELINEDWSDLRGQFYAWVEGAQASALRTAAKLANLPLDDPRLARAAQRMREAIDPAWSAFTAELNARAEHLLYNPDPNSDAAISVNPNTVVPVGAVRRALAVAGGAKPKSTDAIVASLATALDYSGAAEYLHVPEGTVRRLARERQIAHLRIANRVMFDPADLDSFLTASRVEAFAEGDDNEGQTDALDATDVSTPIDQIESPEGAAVSVELSPVDGQIGTGDAVSDVLSDEMVPVSFEWVHGGTAHPLEGHEDLDGTAFTSFDDDELANTADDWIGNDYYFPGDHDGCSCDFTTVWGPPPVADTTAAPDAGGADGIGRTLLNSASAVLDRDAQNAAIERWAQIGGHLDASDDDKALMEQALRGRGTQAGETLYRGTAMDESDIPKVGKRINVPLASGSPGEENAAAYAENAAIDGGKPVMFEYPSSTTSLDISDRAVVQAEDEHLLGGNFKVTSVTTDDEGTVHVKLETSGKSWDISDHLSDIYAGKNIESLADTGSSFLSDTVRDLLASPDAKADDLKAAQQSLMPEIRQAGEEANANLERMGGRTIQAIGRTGGVDGTSGEYDWFAQLSDDEKDRLRNNGFTSSADSSLNRPDQLVAGFEDVTGATDATTDQAMEYWLQQTRISDASQLLQNTSKMPGNLARFGNFNWDSLTTTNVDVPQLFAPKADAIAYLNGAQQEAAYDLAQRELTASDGPSLYEMSYSDYEQTVNALGDQIENAQPVSSDPEFGDVFSAADEAALARYNELVPEALAPEGQDVNLYQIWLQGQQIAQAAGLTGQGAA